MFTIENLLFTKFFEVQSPIGLEQRGENLGNYSIGMDVYVPENTSEFRTALLKSNEKKYDGLYITDFQIEDTLYWKYLDDDDNLIMEIIQTPEKIEYTIFKPFQIPTGIGILIPNNCWAEMCTKSSNFTFGYGQNEGKIDMNYTYGMGVQLFPINNAIIKFEPTQKFAQLIFHEAVPIMSTTEVSLDDWKDNPLVCERREKRTGGFGHTGKFDK